MFCYKGMIKKNKLKKIIVNGISFIYFGMFFIVSIVFADTGMFNDPVGRTNPDFAIFVENIVQSLVVILFPIVILLFIYTGFLFVKAQGKPAELEKARSAFVWSFVGAMLVLGAWALLHIVENTMSNFNITT